MTPKEKLKAAMLDQFKRTHPNVPDYAIPTKQNKKSDANQLSNDIQEFCKLNGHHCSVVSTMGTYREGVGYTNGNNTLGASDTSIIMKSNTGKVIAWECEIKIGRDKMSPAQIKYSKSVIKAGGHYSIVKTFDDFFEQYNKLICI